MRKSWTSPKQRETGRHGRSPRRCGELLAKGDVKVPPRRLRMDAPCALARVAGERAGGGMSGAPGGEHSANVKKRSTRRQLPADERSKEVKIDEHTPAR